MKDIRNMPLNMNDMRWHGGAPTLVGGSGITIVTNPDGTVTISTSGLGAISIGDTVISGTPNSVLYIGATGLLAQDNANFSYNSTTKAFFVSGSVSSAILAATNYIDLTDHAAPTKVAGHALITSFAQSGSSRPRLTQGLGSTDFILGRDNTLVVHNTTGGIIAKGSPVRIIFFASGIPSVVPAIANSVTTLPAVGLAVDNIPAFGEGFVMKLGIIAGVNTSGYTVGDTLYVSTTV